jgi:ABC-type methionine transport system ATPase subunit
VVRAICHRAAVVAQGTIAEIFPVVDGVAQAHSAAGLALLEEA